MGKSVRPPAILGRRSVRFWIRFNRFVQRLGEFAKRVAKASVSLERLIGYVILAVFLFIGVQDPYPKQFLRLKTFDFYQDTKPRPIPPLDQQPAAIIDIDEASLTELGQWPWPRTLIAQLVRNAFQLGAAQVAFDIVFPEPDRMNPASIIESIPRIPDEAAAHLRKLQSNDSILADVIRNAPVVLGQAGFFQEQEGEKAPPIKKTIAIRKLQKNAPDPKVFLPDFKTLIRNVPEIEKASNHKLGGRGIFSLVPEPDGIVRRVPSLFVHDGEMYPGLSIEMLRAASGRSTVLVQVSNAGIDQIKITPRLSIPTDRIGRVYPYFSRQDHNKYVSAKDIINGTADPKRLQGKLMLMGPSAVGLLDIRSIPTEPVIPGVEVHIQMIESAVHGLWLTRPNFADGIELAALFFGGLLVIVFAPWISAKWTALIFLSISGAFVAGSWFAFTEYLWLLDAGYTVICILLLYTVLTYTGYAREESSRRQTRDAFSKYLSPDMVKRVADNPDELKLGGEQREMTLLFCDVRGFTTISEQFDAVGLTALINKLLTPLTNVILERQGTIDKYMGDCIMAFWNAPLDDDDQEYNGCDSALAMLAEMEPLNTRLEQEAKEEGRKHVPLKVGLGLNTGPCVVGNMGSDMRFDYSVLGDAVNLAARLEGQSKSYGMNVVLGPNTHAKVQDRLATIDLDYIMVKGKTSGTYIYGLMGDGDVLADPQFQALAKKIHDAQETYRHQKWDEAEKLFNEIKDEGSEGKRPWKLDIDMDVFCELYFERIAEYRKVPPAADWDGVFVATSK